MDEDRTVCVGLDTHKAKIAVAVAEPGRSGEVRFQGEIANQPEAVRHLIERLGGEARHGSGSATRPARAATACTGRSPRSATTARWWRPR